MVRRIRKNVGYAIRPGSAQQEAQQLFKEVLDEVKNTPPYLKVTDGAPIPLQEIAEFGSDRKSRHVRVEYRGSTRPQESEILGLARISSDSLELITLERGENTVVSRHRRGVARLFGDRADNTAFAFAGVRRALAIMKEDGPVKFVNPKTS